MEQKFTFPLQLGLCFLSLDLFSGAFSYRLVKDDFCANWKKKILTCSSFFTCQKHFVWSPPMSSPDCFCKYIKVRFALMSIYMCMCISMVYICITNRLWKNLFYPSQFPQFTPSQTPAIESNCNDLHSTNKDAKRGQSFTPALVEVKNETTHTRDVHYSLVKSTNN